MSLFPKDWPKDRRLVWTLTTHGITNQAKGWLQAEWEVDKGVIAKNAARDPSLMTAGTNERDIDHQNVAPAIAAIPPQTINLGGYADIGCDGDRRWSSETNSRK